MVEPLFRFDADVSVGDVVTLDSEQSHHALSVRRLRAGERVQLTNGTTLHSRGEVVGADGKLLQVKIAEVRNIEPTQVQFTLVQALAKGDRDELAIQAATELGVSDVIPWQADRSISKWDATKATKQVTRWQTICDEASKQSLRPVFVKVNQPVTTSALSKQISSSDALWLVLDPTAERSIAAIDMPISGWVHLIVGPEGGISAEELIQFEAAGARRVNLGEGVLRTSTAGIAALSYLSGRMGLWG